MLSSENGLGTRQFRLASRPPSGGKPGGDETRETRGKPGEGNPGGNPGGKPGDRGNPGTDGKFTKHQAVVTKRLA